MQNSHTTERCFKIDNIEYHLKLIPTKYFDSDKQKPSFFRRLSMCLSKVYSFSKTKGIVEYEKKMWGNYLARLDNAKNIGTFSEEWHEGLEECPHYLTIELIKEHPKKIILIEDLDSDAFGRVELNKKLIEKTGFMKTKSTSLEEIK